MNQKSNNGQEYPTVNRQYKDRLFRMVFSRKEDLLSLYNAVNGTDYSDPDELEVTTLENALYLSMKNDMAFLLNIVLNLYEHQSTFNPNMPTRALLYFAKVYEKFIAKHEINIYSSTPKKLPFPQHIVFYNGTRDEPDRQILKLSDLFEKPPSDLTPCLECTSLMLNINYGHNRALMERCRRLEEYALFVDSVRKNLASGLPLEQAVSQSVDECIQKDILKDILTAQKAEVVQVVLETFDQEKYEKAMKQEGYEDGYHDGRNAGYNAGRTDGYSAGCEEGLRQLIAALMDIREKYGMSENEIISEIMQKYNLTEDEAVKKISEFRAG